MQTTLEDSCSMKSHETLDKVFHVLFTQSMYTELEALSTRRRVSKGALIRLAIEEYVRQLDHEHSDNMT
jgi:hypothetical protein